MKKLVLPGSLLLLAGIYLLLSRLPGVDLPMGSFLMLMGAGFLVVRAVTRKYGWSFASFPLLFVGLGWVMVRLLHLGSSYIAAATLLGLSLAFFFIHICEFRRIGNWPMIPAILLLLAGAAALCLVTPEIRRFLRNMEDYILPALLIVGGAVLLLAGVIACVKPRAKKPESETTYAPPYVPPQEPVKEPETVFAASGEEDGKPEIVIEPKSEE